MTVAREKLLRLPLFQDASLQAVDALAKRGFEADFLTDAVIFLTGTTPRGWYVVLEGCVRVVRGSGARQHVIHTESAGGTLGEVPMFGGTMHPATGIAAEPTRCAIFDRSSLEAAMTECPEIAFLINRRLALRVKRLVERLDERSHSVGGRLAEFLVDRLDSSPSGRQVSLGMTQQNLAEELGTVREVVSREIRLLVQSRVVASLGGGRYEIVRADELRARAKDGQ